jgi:hypothetical protein
MRIFHPSFSRPGLFLLFLGIVAALPTFAAPDSNLVTQLRTPNGGIQPQAALDSKGVLHLVYYKGDPAAGDLFYVRRQPSGGGFSDPLRVNRQPGSAIAVGTIRGAQIAIGKNGRVHVVWNGSSRASGGAHAGAPLLYTRLNDAGAAFEPERDLISYAAGLDGGSSVAADQEGNVYATWHARTADSPEGEEGRAVFVARSADEGKTFAREEPALSAAAGVCACCGMRAFADSKGAVYMLFRGAAAITNRDEVLLISRDQGKHFQPLQSHRWISATCPMSSAALTQGAGPVVASWETAGQVYFSTVSPDTGVVSPPCAPPGTGERKHPVAVQSKRGEILLVWAEGTGWEKGGTLAWQVFDAQRQPTTERGKIPGIPVWSLATAVAQPNGAFLIVY